MRSKSLKALRTPLTLAAALSLLAMAGCGGGYSTTLTTPQDGAMLLIGSVIVENVGYGSRQEYYTQDIEVSFMSDVEEEGKVVRKAITIFADPNGYFCVENVPQGEYALKGIRVISPAGNWTFWNELRMPNERWAMGPYDYRYPFTGEYFPVGPIGNVFNFHHNVFSALLGQEVRHAVMAQMQDDRFHLTDSYTRGLVVEYFIERYPDSGWVPTLQEQLPENRRPPQD